MRTRSKSFLATMALAVAATAATAQGDVTLRRSGNSTTMSNGTVELTIGSNGRISSMTYNGGSNILASSGIYFDYTAAANTGLDPSEVEVVKQTADYAEVVYRNTSADLRFEQGFIMRKGVNGVYVYVIANGTPKSSGVNLREARVCTRLNSSYINGYVDDRMNGRIPTNTQMAEAEKEANTIQDATYRLADGSIYTKYDWAQYVVNDSVHGLMNNVAGVWNIACSHEWLNGGPMRQELTAHATSRSPITIQMIQGEHFGAASQSFEDGERKLYGPFFIYVNRGTKENMVIDAKAQASKQMAEWPFEWFEHELYPLDRATVSGRLSVDTGQRCDSVQVLLAEPGTDPYLQGKGYMFWALTDADGRFTIEHVRKGEYTLYAYATAGDVTDELQVDGIVVDGEAVELGTLNWTPACYERTLWRIGENNRKSDGFAYSDSLRAYGLWDVPSANLTFTIGQSHEATDWYFAQTQNGTWTVAFDLDEPCTGTAHLTASIAGSTNKPTVAVSVNGSRQGTWNFDHNDAAIYRSALLGGRHTVRTLDFPASLLRKGTNTVAFTMSGISRNGGVMYDCVKLEVGDQVASGIAQLAGEADGPVDVYTLSGVKVGTFDSLRDVSVRGLHIYKQGGKAGKMCF